MKTRIRDIRKSKKWTLDHLADLVGTSKGHLSDIETDKREPSTKMLGDIAKALGVTEIELIGASNETDAALAEILTDFMKLSEEDRLAVARHARSLVPRDEP